MTETLAKIDELAGDLCCTAHANRHGKRREPDQEKIAAELLAAADALCAEARSYEAGVIQQRVRKLVDMCATPSKDFRRELRALNDLRDAIAICKGEPVL
jgi:hypothetical protein